MAPDCEFQGELTRFFVVPFLPPSLSRSMNAPIMVDLEGETDPLKIAIKELKEKKIPINVRRYLPDNSYEDRSVNELTIDWSTT